MARDLSPTELAELVNEETVKTFIDLSIAYAKLYQENPRAFIMSFRKFKSIRMASAFIVTVYRSQGLLKECKEATGKDFSKYAEKYFDGPTAKVFGEILLIIYAITR